MKFRCLASAGSIFQLPSAIINSKFYLAEVSDVNFAKSNIEQWQINESISEGGTKLPDNIEEPAHWRLRPLTLQIKHVDGSRIISLDHFKTNE